MTESHPTQQNPLTRNWHWRIIQFALQCFFSIWFRARVRGIEKLPAGGALLLINHQSFLDPLLVGLWLKRPVSFLARDNLFRVPLVGWILKNTYVMPIHRESAGTDSLRKSISRLQNGFYVGLFPEGTRTIDGTMGEIKPGFIAIARRSDVPIVPVGIAGADRAMPKGSNFLWPVSIRVVYGDPICAERVAELSQKGREKEFLKAVQVEIEQARQQAEHWRTGRLVEVAASPKHD